MADQGDTGYPAIMDQSLWAHTPLDCRDEAIARTAYLMARGMNPTEASRLVHRDIIEDERYVERQPSWTTVATLAMAWDAPARMPDGRPMPAIPALAILIDEAADEAVHTPRAPAPVGRWEAACPNSRVSAAALRAFHARVAVLRPPPDTYERA